MKREARALVKSIGSVHGDQMQFAFAALGALLLPHRAGFRPQRTPTPRASIAEYIQTDGLPRIEPVVAGSRTTVTAATDEQKPVLIYLPGIEMSGYTWSKQTERLSADFELRALRVPTSDRTTLDGLADVVVETIEALPDGASAYLLGESFGGVLALRVATRKPAPPALKGLALVNPATSVDRAWPAQLPPLLDALETLPPALGDAAYRSLQAPIIALTAGEPLRMAARPGDARLPPPAQLLAALPRLAAQTPEVLQLGSALPLGCLNFRLAELRAGAAAINEDTKALKALSLPVQLFASTEDKILPSVDECRRLSRRLGNARVTTLQASGHCPLLEGEVSLADLLEKAELTRRAPAKRKDYIADFVPPTAEAVRNATERLAGVRKATSPVFVSTLDDGRRVSGLRGLPPLDTKKPTLFVGNHQLYGFLDLPLVVEEVLNERGTLLRALAHPVAFGSGGGGGGGEGGDGERRGGGGAGGFVDYETFGAVPVSGRALFQLLKRGEPALLYPGGVREAFKSTKAGESYKLFWPEGTSDFARVAARFGATIVPVAAVGAEESFEMILDADELLALPVVGDRLRESAKSAPVGRAGERFVGPLSVPTLPDRFYFCFGRPIETDAVDASDAAACEELYSEVQRELEGDLAWLLARRTEDPYRAPVPRVPVEASWEWKKQAPSFKVE